MLELDSMLIVVENIDFRQSQIRVRITGAIERTHTHRLNELFNKCKRFNLTNIIIQITEDMMQESYAILSNMASSYNASIVKDKQYSEGGNSRSKKSARVFCQIINPLLGDVINNHEYNFNTSNLSVAAEEIQAVISIISEALDLDDKTYYRLKLCIYELTANSIEHGIFETKLPKISLAVRTSNKSLFVCYKDNAGEFALDAFRNINIKEKIKAKNTRGYGLFIMNCLTRDLQVSRVKNVNQTTFTIKMPDKQKDSEHGRIKMDPFSIKLITCDIEDAMIVKPIGSIDSMTTQSVEEQLISLMDNRTKYIIMDFSEVTFISSAGIGILLGTISTMREEGGDLILMRIQPQIKEIFDILNISDYFVTIHNIGELKDSIHSKT
jgi:anti-sigma B factor antagonist